MNYKVIELTKEYHVDWDKFCLDNDEAWFWHTTSWLEYSLEYRPEANGRSASFFVKDDFGIAAVCPLLIEETKSCGSRVVSFSNLAGSGYVVVPAVRNDINERQKERLLRFIYERIDEIAVRNNVAKALSCFTPLAKQRSFYNFLMKFDFVDTSFNTQIIDLSFPLDDLLKDIRKGHKYDIKRGERAYVVETFDKDSVNEEIFEKYRLLHRKAAGRVTRPKITFDIMRRWVLNDVAALFAARDTQKEYIGFVLVNIFKDGAYYNSAADDPEADTTIPVSHFLQWNIIKWLKEKGIRSYEVGYQQFGHQFYDHPSRKNIDISFFKRGFGGKTVTLYRGVKYYDKEHMKKDIENNVQRFLEGF